MNKWYHNPKPWIDKWELIKKCSDCEERVSDYKRYEAKGLNDKDDEAHKLRSSHFCFEHNYENPLKLKDDERKKVRELRTDKLWILFLMIVVGLIGSSFLISAIEEQKSSSRLFSLAIFLFFSAIFATLLYYFFRGNKSDKKELEEIRDKLRQWRRKETDEDFKKGQCEPCQKEGRKWFCQDCPFSKAQWKTSDGQTVKSESE